MNEQAVKIITDQAEIIKNLIEINLKANEQIEIQKELIKQQKEMIHLQNKKLRMVESTNG